MRARRRYFRFGFLGLTVLALLLGGCVTHRRHSAQAASPHPTQSKSQNHAAQSGPLIPALSRPQMAAMMMFSRAKTRHNGQDALMASLLAMRADDYALQEKAARYAHQLLAGEPQPLQMLLLSQLAQAKLKAARKTANKLYVNSGAQALRAVFSIGIDSVLKEYLLRPIARRNPRDVQLSLMLANAASDQGNNRLALKEANRVLKHHPEMSAARFVKIQAMAGLGEFHKALRSARKLAAAHASNADLALFYLAVLQEANNRQLAHRELALLSKRFPHDDRVSFAIAVDDFNNGNLSAAKHRLTKLLENGNKVSGLYHLLGTIAQSQKKWGRAFGWYQQVNPGAFFETSRSRAAWVLMRWKNLNAARRYFSELRKHYPLYSPVWYQAEGVLLQNQHKAAQATRVLKNAVSKYPMIAELHYQLALAADASGDARSAFSQIRGLVRRHPNNPTYLNAMGYMLVEHTHRYREAYRFIRRALTKEPKNGAIMDSMGWVLFKEGRIYKALPYLKKAWRKTQDPEVAAHLIRAYLKTDQAKKARTLWEKAHQSHPKAHVLQVLKAQVGP